MGVVAAAGMGVVAGMAVGVVVAGMAVGVVVAGMAVGEAGAGTAGSMLPMVALVMGGVGLTLTMDIHLAATP
jgi:hypothetical protein